MKTLKKVILGLVITVSFASCYVGYYPPPHRHYYHYHHWHHYHHGYGGGYYGGPR